jgi:hypothetical protein
MDPLDVLEWPHLVVENGAPRVLNNGAEYREYVALMQHRIDFQISDLLEKKG